MEDFTLEFSDGLTPLQYILKTNIAVFLPPKADQKAADGADFNKEL